MTSVSNCVVCGGAIECRKRGLVAPFLAWRIWKRPPFPVEVVECLSCGFIFYSPRLDPDEEGRLYARYRSNEYQRMRHSLEPWYTEKLNRNLRNEDFFTIRKQRIVEILRHRLPQEPTRILDFGGDRGELVKDLLPGAKSFVYDISAVAPVDGVESCGDLAACRAHNFDLILNSNVLEHVGFPHTLIAQLTSIAAPGSMAFIEVPHESPFDRVTMLKRLVQGCVLAMTRPRTALSLACRGLLYLMHEHVNFFTPNSLKVLMTRAGWNVVDAGTYHLDCPSGSVSMAWCLAQQAVRNKPSSIP